jgi:hypothetical protein
MNRFKDKSVYVSGKITGDPGFKAKFAQYSAAVLAAGASRCVNPAELLPSVGHTYEEYIMTDLQFVARCQAILMLPCWEDSPGATAELALAQCLKKEVIYATDL